jgi:hypothetical protein
MEVLKIVFCGYAINHSVESIKPLVDRYID